MTSKTAKMDAEKASPREKLLILIKNISNLEFVKRFLIEHKDIDINYYGTETENVTAFYHLLKQPGVTLAAVQAFDQYPGIDINARSHTISTSHHFLSQQTQNRKHDEMDNHNEDLIKIFKMLVSKVDYINAIEEEPIVRYLQLACYNDMNFGWLFKECVMVLLNHTPHTHNDIDVPMFETGENMIEILLRSWESSHVQNWKQDMLLAIVDKLNLNIASMLKIIKQKQPYKIEYKLELLSLLENLTTKAGFIPSGSSVNITQLISVQWPENANETIVHILNNILESDFDINGCSDVPFITQLLNQSSDKLYLQKAKEICKRVDFDPHAPTRHWNTILTDIMQLFNQNTNSKTQEILTEIVLLILCHKKFNMRKEQISGGSFLNELFKTIDANRPEWNADREKIYMAILNNGYDINLCTENVSPLFHTLTETRANCSVLKKLKDICARTDFDPNSTDKKGATPLEKLFSKNRSIQGSRVGTWLEIITILFDHDKVITEKSMVSLLEKEYTDNISYDAFYKKLLDKGYDINARSTSTPLFCLLGKYPNIKCTLERLKNLCSHPEFDPNAADKDGNTVLMAAVSLKQPHDYELTRMLLQKENIDINAVNSEGLNALQRVTSINVIQLLLEDERLDVNATYPKNSNLTRYLLSLWGEIIDTNVLTQMLKILVKRKGYYPNQVDQDGTPNLSWVLQYIEHIPAGTFLNMVESLDVNICDRDLRSPFSYAAEHWDVKTMQLIVDHPTFNADECFNKKDVYGKTYLHYLCQFKTNQAVIDMDYSLIKEYIDQSDINIQDGDSYTPIIVCIKNYKDDICVRDAMAEIIHCLLNHPTITCNLSLTDKFDQTVDEIMKYTPSLDPRVKSMLDKQLGKKRSIDDLSISDHIQYAQSKLRDSNLSNVEKEHMSFLFKFNQSTLDSFNSGSHVSIDADAREKLTRNWKYIIEELMPTELLPYLFEKKILTEHEYDKIDKVPTRFEKVKELLSIIIHRGKDGYDAFMAALRETRQAHIADRINSANNEVVVSSGVMEPLYIFQGSKRFKITSCDDQ